MTTSFKVNLDLQANAILPEEPVWEGRWRNLYFTKAGHSCFGYMTFDTESQALAGYQQYLKGCESAHICKCECGIIYSPDEHSHAIPMPIREGGE